MLILCSSDNKYAQHLGVMLTSLFENCNMNLPDEVAIIDDNIDDQNIRNLNLIFNRYGVKYRYISFGNRELSHLKPKNNKTIAAFYRIFVDEFYPEETEKVLYLDCDIVVRKDISKLFNTDLSGYIIGAVPNDGLNYQDILGMPEKKVFFNSGIMLINLKGWRAGKIKNRLIDFINNNFEKMKRNDQDALNAVLFNEWLPLDPGWNAHLYIFTSPHLCSSGRDKIDNAIRDPSVVHFTTGDKPWLFRNRHPFKKEYWRYLKMTPWKSYKTPDMSLKVVIEKAYTSCYLVVKTNFKMVKRALKNMFIKA